MKASDILPDQVNQGDFNGVTIRKGTIGAFLANAKQLQQPHLTPEARATLEHDIIEALPALRAVGLFEVMQIRDEGLRALVEKH